jgi:sporulation protein YlmC with PRC-barrel domain
MKITSKKLIGLPVETKSGQNLGRIDSFAIDTDFQNISEYYVKPIGIVGGLVKGKLMISRGQVIDITAKKMIVDDNLSTDKEKEIITQKNKVIAGATMKEIDINL